MIKELQIPLLDLVMCLSDSMDLVNPILVNHHQQVAYIAFSIGAEIGLPSKQQNELMLAGLLHDSGALSLKARIDALQFETVNPHEHAELGYQLLKSFEPLSTAALLVRYHHVPWSEGGGSEFKGEQVPMGSHILHLADRVAVLINKKQEILGQSRMICKRIEGLSRKKFMPQLVDAFKSLAAKEYFWLNAASQSISPALRHRVGFESIELNIEGILSLANLFRQIIDFRSRFTATHSSGVAASAEALARFIGFSERECQMMTVAGYLHDLGKLAVPAEILEKPAKLTEDEFNLIKAHTFHTYYTLNSISDFEVINTWGAFHHERLDGNGYPFHIRGNDLALGSRIMAVADVFTAISEDRPYRKGMTGKTVLQVLQQMADSSALDSSIVSLLRLHYDEINSHRKLVQTASVEEYRKFLQPLG